MKSAPSRDVVSCDPFAAWNARMIAGLASNNAPLSRTLFTPRSTSARDRYLRVEKDEDRTAAPHIRKTMSRHTRILPHTHMSCHTHTHTPSSSSSYAPVAVRVKVTEHPLPPRRVRLPRPHRELARHRRPVLRPHHRPPRRAEHAGARFVRARRQRLGPAAGPGVRLALLVRRRPSHERAVLAEVLVGRQHRVGELLHRDAPGPVRVVPPEERLHLVVPHAVQEAPQPLLERRRPQVLRAVLLPPTG